MIDEITIEQEQSSPAKKETPSNLKPNDPRGKSTLNKLASEPASMARKQSADDAMSELRRACMQDDQQLQMPSQTEMTIAEEQRAIQNEALINKRLEKALRK